MSVKPRQEKARPKCKSHWIQKLKEIQTMKQKLKPVNISWYWMISTSDVSCEAESKCNQIFKSSISSFLGSYKLQEQCMRSVFQRAVSRSFIEQLAFPFSAVSLIDELYCFIFHHSESGFSIYHANQCARQFAGFKVADCGCYTKQCQQHNKRLRLALPILSLLFIY